MTTSSTPDPTPAPRGWYAKTQVPANATGYLVRDWDDIAPAELVAEWEREDPDLDDSMRGQAFGAGQDVGEHRGVSGEHAERFWSVWADQTGTDPARRAVVREVEAVLDNSDADSDDLL